MSAEVVPLRPAVAPVAVEPPLPGPVAVPPHVVAAIARAAVEAYVKAERARKAAEQRARYHGDPEYRARQLAGQRASRERKALERKVHPLR